MHRIVIASDSFKGSLSSMEVAEAVSKGIKQIFPTCETIMIPTADGGEGTLDAIMEHKSDMYHKIRVHGPNGKPIDAIYGIYSEDNEACHEDTAELSEGSRRVAMIEAAKAIGLTLIPEPERNPMTASSYGLGEMILDAIKQGCRKFLIGLGGSATNDGGCGMLEALGYTFRDKDGNRLERCNGEILSKICEIDSSGVEDAIYDSTFTIACDVDTVFWGKNGAAEMFAPQKGADPEMVASLDKGMKNFAEIMQKHTGRNPDNIPGSGAAGGLGGAFAVLLDGRLVKGIDAVLDMTGFDKVIEGCDMIITGEGKLDEQSIHGKVPYGILERGKRHHIPVVAICGICDIDEVTLIAAGFSSIIPIQPRPVSHEELVTAMKPENAKENITASIADYLRKMKFSL